MKTWFSNLTSGVVGGVVSGIVVVIALGWWAPQLSDRLQEVNPTCDQPRGLVPLTRGDYLEGSAAAEGYAQDKTFGADKVLDGYPGSIWIPSLPPANEREAQLGNKVPVFDSQNGNNILTLHLSKSNDIELVCVVNGLGTSYFRYQNWGRARTVSVWAEDEKQKETTVLKSLGADDFSNAQMAAKRIGVTKTVHIRLDDAYVGLIVETSDPDVCYEGQDVAKLVDNLATIDGKKMGREPQLDRGCFARATTKAGLADVFLYRRAG